MLVYKNPHKNIFIGIVIIVIVAIFVCANSNKVFASNACSNGTTVNIIAHEDDDILFLSPDILHNIQDDRCVVSVVVTAGDADQGSSYWHSREDGMKAAYALMSGYQNSWTKSSLDLTNATLTTFKLNGNSALSLVFLRLPDGNWDGSGFSNNNYESLQKLWQGSISNIHAVDSSVTYTKQSLIDTLAEILNNYNPDQIRIQNYVDNYTTDDHSDHYSTAYFAYNAHKKYLQTHILTGYLGYQIANKAINIFGDDVTNKQNTFITYAQHDNMVCQTLNECQQTSYGAWLLRQYVVGSETYTAQNSTNYKELFPWKTEHRIVRQDLNCSPCFYNSPKPAECIWKGNDEFKCIRNIGTDEVLDAVNSLLRKK